MNDVDPLAGQVNKPREVGVCRKPLRLKATHLAQNNAEILIVLHEFQDVDDDFARPCIEHDALHLTHLMQPKLSKILIDRCSGLAPQLQASFGTRELILDLEHRGPEGFAIGGRNCIADETEACLQCRFRALSVPPGDHARVVSESRC